MSKVIFADAPAIAAYVREKTGASAYAFTDVTAIGIKDGDRIIGGVLYENYTGPGGCIEAHVAGEGPGWMTPRFVRLMFFYPFVQLGCKVLRGRVPSTNVQALRFDLKLGFKLEHLLKDATPEGDQWLLAMWREDCRFLETRHGQQV